MIDIKFLDSMDIFRAHNIKAKKIRDVKVNQELFQNQQNESLKQKNSNSTEVNKSNEIDKILDEFEDED